MIRTLDHTYGLLIVDGIRAFLGLMTMIGAFGFFISTSARRTHWNPYIRRTFFGIFVFCNIFFHAIFNVFNVPNNTELLCWLGSCITRNEKENV